MHCGALASPAIKSPAYVHVIETGFTVGSFVHISATGHRQQQQQQPGLELQRLHFDYAFGQRYMKAPMQLRLEGGTGAPQQL
jgi:hypothetical protein